MKLEKKFMLGSTVQMNKIISSQIAKVKIYIMYAGKNRNNTHFTKEMIEQKLAPTIYGMPIIGEFSKDKGEFGGHGGKITITDEGMDYEETTVAYGFIPESSEIRWETVLERDGMTEREYLTADGYVWYKRFPELESILDEPKGQSMEIEIKDAFWNDELNAYDILDAELTGLCILGVEPCFESAKIGRFALESMKYELSEMAKELKETLKSEVTEVNQVDETVVEDTTPEVETVEVEEVEETVEVEATTETEETVETEVEVEPTEEEPQKEDETEVEPIETQDETVEPEVVEVETTETEAETVETVDYAQENADFKAKIEAYEAELAELRAFKANIELQEKEAVVNSFKSEFTDEELAPVVEKIEEFSKDDLEIQLFALLGKKQKQYSAQVQPEVAQDEKVLTVATYQVEEETLPSWARAIEKYNLN